jgi:YfiH family protein
MKNGPGISVAPFQHFNLGTRCGDELAHVEHNRAALIQEYALPSAPHWLQQVHGMDVVRLGVENRNAACRSQQNQEPIADAAVTHSPNTVLAVLTADCMPVFFCNKQGSEIAIAHAGWRGLVGGVLEATLAKMRSERNDILVYFGPAAGALHYEIGEEVRQAFIAMHSDAHCAFTETRVGHYLIDMLAIAKQRLSVLGVTQFFGGEHCTLSDTRFYSHRREQRTGRMASIIWMRE